ncbi:hypothetical protein SAMN02745119_02009 [Trichlorobacter thiogenes]|uniref:Uncharacterized protein n=1 Tax=Trichlorobacter thiogenes TaxID=115783 RepID=A0A1T4PME9_9BACT|nr:hypothetical protein [Trichlorobacter thiogenes]SJZ92068.1 hypothetical protein SAMN02745119_02009 [Trichlorobacter thiogenes]
MATEESSNPKLIRLREALVAAGVKRGERNKTVATTTDYAEGSVRQLLSGSTPLTDRFVKAVCYRLGISLKWINDGEEPMLARPGEQPYPGGGYGEQTPKVEAPPVLESEPKAVAQIGVPERLAYSVAGIPYPKIAGVTGTETLGEAEYTALLNDIRDKIKLYMTCVDTGGVLGWAAYINFLNMIMLPPHEMIDLAYQFRKLYDGDSDQLATAAADEKLEKSSIKPGATRIKLERIPVEPDEAKQEK